MTNSDSRRKSWQKRESEGLCIYCGKNTPVKNKKGCQDCLSKKVAITVKFCKNNKETTSQYRLLVKHEVIEKYGGKCLCCGEEQILFLTIDHKNNDGHEDRQKYTEQKTHHQHLGILN